jgi:DNA-binding XRE family transcriptional regulator
MKSGKLFEDALKKAGIELHPGDELKVKVKKKGKYLELVINSSNLSPFEYEILRRSRRVASSGKAYKPDMSPGERVRNLRKAAGLSLSALAEKSGVSKGSLGSIENDERSAGLNVLKRIAEALEIDVSVLVN